MVLFLFEGKFFCLGRFCWDLVRVICCFVYCMLVNGYILKFLSVGFVNWVCIEWCNLLSWFLFMFVFLILIDFLIFFGVVSCFIFVFFDFKEGL